jgi:hypothetical protein
VSGSLPDWLVRADYTQSVQKNLHGKVQELEISENDIRRLTLHVEAIIKKYESHEKKRGGC